MPQQLQDFLNGLSLPGSDVSLARVLSAMALVLLVWWLAGLMERTLLRQTERHGTLPPERRAKLHILSRLLRYTVWVLGTLVVLGQVGIDLSSITLLGSALAVGLGFGLQNIISNFVAGVILLVERTLKVGDFVDLESGVRGHVREIGMRFTRIGTNDAIDVLVPNAEFINGRVVNWTHSGTTRRMRLPFGVAYGTDKEKVRRAGIAAATRVPGVVDADRQRPDVWLVSYGDSAMNFELVVWVDHELTTHPASTHAKLMWALDDELHRQGIEIPFPQRELRWRTPPTGSEPIAPGQPQ